MIPKCLIENPYKYFALPSINKKDVEIMKFMLENHSSPVIHSREFRSEKNMFRLLREYPQLFSKINATLDKFVVFGEDCSHKQRGL